MTSIITLSMIGIIVAFLVSVLATFPGAGDTVVPDESYSVNAMEQVGGLLSNNIMSLIDDMVAFQTDPDYDRAEAKRLEFVALGTNLAGMFSDFEDRMTGEFDMLIAQAEELEAGSEPTP